MVDIDCTESSGPARDPALESFNTGCPWLISKFWIYGIEIPGTVAGKIGSLEIALTHLFSTSEG
jgi:hypothetical protein